MATRGPFPWRMSLAFVLSLAAAGAIGYYAWQLRTDREAMRGELADTREQAHALPLEQQKTAKLSEQLGACATERDAERLRCEAAEVEVEAMRQDLDATRAELDDVRKQRAQAAKRIEQFKELTAKFQQMIDSGRLDVVVRDGRMLVQLPAGVLFESGSAELSRDGELALMEVAVVLRDIENRQFMIAGHTDDRPVENAAETSRYRNNWELSTARAVTVVKFLIEARLKPANLIAAGLGQHDPIGDNRSPQGRQTNRRIEIVLLPNIDELPTMPDEAGATSP